MRRFFATGDHDQLSRQILRAYDDEVLLAAVMGVLFLEAEPLVGKLVGDRLWGLPAGSTFCAFMSDSCKASSLLHAILLANALVDFTQIRDEA